MRGPAGLFDSGRSSATATPRRLDHDDRSGGGGADQLGRSKVQVADRGCLHVFIVDRAFSFLITLGTCKAEQLS